MSKVMEGEAILLNVVNGRYYSLDGAGCVAWAYLSGGASVAETAAVVVERYGADPEAVERDLTALVSALLEQDLLVAAAAAGTVVAVDETGLPERGGATEPYAAPELLAFTDMEDLLALDPPLPSFPVT